jgi:hypothetical protein
VAAIGSVPSRLEGPSHNFQSSRRVLSEDGENSGQVSP